jgi:hypothetical protein
LTYSLPLGVPPKITLRNRKRQALISNGITRISYLWTLFMISLLFGGGYALLLERNLTPSSFHALTLLLP